MANPNSNLKTRLIKNEIISLFIAIICLHISPIAALIFTTKSKRGKFLKWFQPIIEEKKNEFYWFKIQPMIEEEKNIGWKFNEILPTLIKSSLGAWMRYEQDFWIGKGLGK